MHEKDEKQIGKFLAYVLRHKPDEIGVRMDSAGWVALDDIVRAVTERFGAGLSDLEAIVAADAKGRYTIQHGRIRANQGHSVPVDLGLVPVDPPARLYHGTVGKFLDAILAEGLRPQGRQHVHLSPDRSTANAVGARRGKPVILTVDAAGLAMRGHLFYQSANGVWLTDHVPPDALAQSEEPAS